MKFGIVTTVSGMDSIVIQSLNVRTNAEIAEARGEDGKVVELKAYSKGKSVDIRALVNADSLTTEAGQTLTIDNVEYIIESTDQAENNTGWVEVSISAKTADSATITTYDSKNEN